MRSSSLQRATSPTSLRTTLLVVAALALGAIGLFSATAGATEAEECVPADAVEVTGGALGVPGTPVCDEATPTPEPTEEVVVLPPTPEPTPAAEQPEDPPEVLPRQLARTGAENSSMAVLGGGLILAGIAIVSTANSFRRRDL